MKIRILIIFAIVMIIPITKSFAEEIKIKFGEIVQYENLNLSFYDIRDSRCPLDVTCIWEGKVTAMISTSNQTHKIGGLFEIGHPLTYMTPYTITLIDVKPHPISTEKPDYVAILDISKIESEPYPVPGTLCPPGKVFDWDICVDECPFGQIERNGICHSFENVYDSNDKLPWYFLIVAYWPASITIVGIIVLWTSDAAADPQTIIREVEYANKKGKRVILLAEKYIDIPDLFQGTKEYLTTESKITDIELVKLVEIIEKTYDLGGFES